MNEIQIFQNVEFGAIRTMSNEQGEPMFCGKDVALALGYKKPLDAIAHHVESEDSVKHGLLDNRGCKQGWKLYRINIPITNTTPI
jgi:prophage antirepressor-like protein